MGSFFYELEDVKFSGSIHYNASNQRILPYEFNVTELAKDNRINYYREGEPDEERYSVYGVQVKK